MTPSIGPSGAAFWVTSSYSFLWLPRARSRSARRYPVHLRLRTLWTSGSDRASRLRFARPVAPDVALQFGRLTVEVGGQCAAADQAVTTLSTSCLATKISGASAKTDNVVIRNHVANETGIYRQFTITRGVLPRTSDQQRIL